MRRHLLSISLITLLTVTTAPVLLTTCRGSGRRSTGRKSTPSEVVLPTKGWQTVGRPLLGFAIERSSENGKHRLVRLEPERFVVETGRLESCEKRRLKELTELHGSGSINVPLPTLGGKQLWADRLLFAGWRIQENVYTGHHRLLDEADIRRAWGTYPACRVALEMARRSEGLAPRSEHLVVLLHGMGRSKDAFWSLSEDLADAGYEVANVNYPSTRKTIREHSTVLGDLLEEYEGVREVSFVTHSLGGIVLRDLLSLHHPWQLSLQVRRAVQLAPPNGGSVAAETFKEWLPYQVVMGVVGQELTPDALRSLPPPRCEFGVIAGGLGDGAGYNPLLEGDDDGVVRVETTRLPGASDFLRLPVSHTLIMQDADCRRAILRFLESGSFREDSTREPILEDAQQESD